MRPPLEIPSPTAEELDALDTLYRTSKHVRLRTRAQMVLLAGEQRLTAPAIAVIVREDDQTVRRWLKRYLAEGIEGLKDRPMPGAPPKSTPAYEEPVLAAVRRRPRSLGQPYSLWTDASVGRLVFRSKPAFGRPTKRCATCEKSGEIVLSRPQHTITSPDPEYLGKKRRLKRPVMA